MEILSRYVEKIKNELPLIEKEEIESILITSTRSSNRKIFFRVAAMLLAILFTTYFLYEKISYKSLNRVDKEIAINDYRYANLINRLSNNPETLEVGLIQSENLQNTKIPINQSVLLSLSKERLRSIGFHITDTYVIYQANVKSGGALMFWVLKNDTGVSVKDQQVDDLPTHDFYPLYLSDLEGRQEVSYHFSGEPKNKREMFAKQINSLIPIAVNVPDSDSQKVFWFLPTEKLLNILEGNLFNSKDLVSDFTPIERKELSLYPNPAKEIFQIDAGFLDDTSKIELLDMQGNSVRVLEPNGFSMSPNSTYKFNVAGINKGIYLIAVSSESNSTIYKRLIITD